MGMGKLKDAQRNISQVIARQHTSSRAPVGVQRPGFFKQGLFVASETFDANLSHITIGGVDVRSVPRCGSAWTTAPSAGTALAVLETGQGSYLILSTIVGNPAASPQLGAGG